MIFPCPPCPLKARITKLEQAQANHDHDHNHDDEYYTKAEVDALLNDKADDDHAHAGSGSFIVGQIVMYAGSFLPSGFLWCNGQPFDSFEYPGLYDAIGYTYGSDGGQPCVPDLQGVFPLGASISHPRGQTGGEAEHTLTVGEMPNHDHHRDPSGHTEYYLTDYA